MKNFIIFALAIFFCIAISGCSWFAKTIPEGFVVFDIDLSGMTEEEAVDVLKDRINNYTVNATISGDNFTIYANQIGMNFNDSYDLSDMVKRTNDGSLTSSMIESNIISLGNNYVIEEGLREAYYNGLSLYVSAYASRIDEIELVETTETTDVSIMIDSNLSKDELQNKMDEYQEKADNVFDSTRAHIEYSQSEGAFISIDGIAGKTKDYSYAVTTLSDAAKKYAENVTLVLHETYSNGELASNVSALDDAIENGNRYLELTINYIFDVPESDTVIKTLDNSNIFNYLYVASNGREVLINETALSIYASDITTETAKITTSDSMNEDKTFTTSISGLSANSNTVYNDIYGAIKEFKSQTFDAVYEDVNESISSENGSVYVYVDLDVQKVYLYENGEVTLTADVVSGCVSKGQSTPDGVFQIYYKQRNATLRGPGYASFVSYWMPFNGGIGLHDADGWRSSYGGNIYLYGGSHGCINLPKWAAATIYDKVSAGTRVIVVGGQKSAYRATVSNTTAAETTAAETTTTLITTTANKTDATKKSTTNDVTTKSGTSTGDIIQNQKNNDNIENKVNNNTLDPAAEGGS